MFFADVGDEMCWLQLWDVGDRQQYDFVTNILNLLQSKSHQNNTVTNTTIAIYKYFDTNTSPLNFFAWK